VRVVYVRGFDSVRSAKICAPWLHGRYSKK